MKRVNIALEHEEFLTFQQRIVSLSSHPVDDSHRHTQVHGMEILNRPKLGIEFSNTEEFYAFSASHGRSRELDAFTIRLGLERVQAAGIQTTSDAAPVPLFFVNVHLSTLFSDYWQKVMTNLPVKPASVVLELSEREGLDTYSKQDVEFMIQELQNHGIKVAVDDVGMGYSGLHTLAMVRPDYVKIDRQLVSFIDQDPYRQHMMRSLVEYWQREQVSTIVEGVERPEEAQFFKGIGTTYAQGYWFHKPESIATAKVPVTG